MKRFTGCFLILIVCCTLYAQKYNIPIKTSIKPQSVNTGRNNSSNGRTNTSSGENKIEQSNIEFIEGLNEMNALDTSFKIKSKEDLLKAKVKPSENNSAVEQTTKYNSVQQSSESHKTIFGYLNIYHADIILVLFILMICINFRQVKKALLIPITIIPAGLFLLFY